MLDYKVRWLMQRDIESIVKFELSTDRPWIQDDIKDALSDKYTIGIIVGHKDDVYGYVIHQVDKRDKSIQILRLLVDEKHRRKKAGTALMKFIKDKLKNGKYKSVHIDVEDSQLDMQLFLKHSGFMATEIIKDKFNDIYQFEYINENYDGL